MSKGIRFTDEFKKDAVAQVVDLSRFSAAPSSHLSCNSFESQWAFPT